jgi:outer membrane protein TolC
VNLFIFSILIFWLGAAQAQKAEPIALKVLLDEARAKNPTILAARKRWESAEALIVPAWTWKDPTVGIHQESFPSDNEKSVHYSIEQEVPFPGKLSTSSRMKYHEAKIAREDYRAKELEVLSEVKIRYHRLAFLLQTAAALNKDAEILRAIARVAQARVASGQGGADEALIAQTQLKAVENAVFEREERGKIEEEDLNSLLAAPPGARRELAFPPEPRDLSLSLDELVVLAKENSPQYLASRHMIHHAQLATSLGRLGFAPDFKLSYEQERFQRRQTETLIGFNLSLPLWFWRPKGELAAAREHTAQALAESREAENVVFRDLYKEHTEVHLHRALTASYQSEILPLAEGALRIAQKNYETGRSNFAQLSEALRSFLEAHIKLYEEVYHYGEHWAMVERIVGRELGGGGI